MRLLAGRVKIQLSIASLKFVTPLTYFPLTLPGSHDVERLKHGDRNHGLRGDGGSTPYSADSCTATTCRQSVV